MNSQKGFTLIEIIAVVVIIGILATLILISVNGVQKKARDGKREADLISLRTALVDYYDDNGNYPNTLDPALVNAGYFSSVPQDPINGMRNGINYIFTYQSINSGQGFVLDAVMERDNLCGPRLYDRTGAGTETVFVVYSDKQDFDTCRTVSADCARWRDASPLPCT